METTQVDIINVSLIEPSLKHPTIFNKFNSLTEHGTFVIDNDHDPKPLYYQLMAEHGPVFSWEYLQSGPERWQVQITRLGKGDNITVGEMVKNDFRKAEVFKKFGIDFCCGGKRTLEETCAKKGVDITAVKRELAAIEQSPSFEGIDFDSYSLTNLIDHIVDKHHAYVTNSLTVLNEFVGKVARVHGESHPEMKKVYELFEMIKLELEGHMLKEERVLFPYIKNLELAKMMDAKSASAGFGTVRNPIAMMEHEHEQVGQYMSEINELTNGYTAPPDACMTFRVSLHKLKEFEDDLHQHIHLENNILFPKAIEMEKEFSVI